MNSDRAAYAVGLWLLACWNCGFESRQWNGCLFLVSVACCLVHVPATGRSSAQRSPTQCVCVLSRNLNNEAT